MALPLLAELKRRRVIRALVGYGVAAFAVLQIIEPVMHGLHWPEEVLSFVVVALAVGFPVVAALAWVFDVHEGRLERVGGGPRGLRLMLIITGVGALAAAPGLLWYFVLRSDHLNAARVQPSIAVLPFVTLSGDKESGYFSDGVTEEIINALANVDGLHVVARTSAFSFRGRNVNVRQIGQELNVATVLEGSVRREGDQLRIAAQLISTADGYHLWSRTFERELKNVFSLEDELARAIVQSLKPKLVPAHALVQRATASPEAHDLYLRGRYFWNQRTKEALAKALSSFERAVAADPMYALAQSGLADCYTLLVDYGAAHSRDVLPKARAHAQTAVELDDSLAEAHASLGAISQHEYDWSTAEGRLKRAIELRPGYATAHQWYAEVLLARGRFGEGIAAAERARQLDPTAPVVNYIVAIAFFVSRDYERAIDQAKKTLELDPDFTFARAYLVLAYLGSGRLADASVALDEARNPSPVLETLRVQVLARRGERAAAGKLLADVERRFASSPFPRIPVAGAHLALGEDVAAFAWLERAVEAREPSVPIGRWSPLWDPVRADPRFRELNRRMNLE